jgi:hypothetical protein
MFKELIELANNLDNNGYQKIADQIDQLIDKVAQQTPVKQATHLLTVSALELFGQAKWTARLSAVETGKVEDTFSATNEEEIKKQVLAKTPGKVVKISSSTKNDQPIVLNWGIPYQK